MTLLCPDTLQSVFSSSHFTTNPLILQPPLFYYMKWTRQGSASRWVATWNSCPPNRSTSNCNWSCRIFDEIDLLIPNAMEYIVFLIEHQQIDHSPPPPQFSFVEQLLTSNSLGHYCHNNLCIYITIHISSHCFVALANILRHLSTCLSTSRMRFLKITIDFSGNMGRYPFRCAGVDFRYSPLSSFPTSWRANHRS